MNTLFFADEVVKNPAKEVTEKGNAAELKMAQTIIESMTGKFEPQNYKANTPSIVRLIALFPSLGSKKIFLLPNVTVT